MCNHCLVHRLLAIIAASLIGLAMFAGPASSAGPIAQQASLTGDPWIDQYIEEVPTATGGRPSHGGNALSPDYSGLSKAEISSLAEAGGQRYAAAMAAATPRTSAREAISREQVAAATPAATAALAETLAGGGDSGLGVLLPIILIGSVFGAIVLAGMRLRSRDSR